MLFDRSARIQNQLQAAETERNDAKQLRTKYEQIINDVEAEKDEILKSARKAAAERSAEMEEVARQEAIAIKARALKEVELEQERVEFEIKQAVIDVSTAIVLKFLTQQIDDETHERLFNETMEELEGIVWQS